MFSNEIIIFPSEIPKKSVSCSTCSNSKQLEAWTSEGSAGSPATSVDPDGVLPEIFGGSSEEGPMGFNGIYMGYLRNDGRNYTTFMGNYNIGIIMG